jgi:hypothetical protein
MSETASSIPPSGLGSLKWSDLWKGLIKTVSGLLVGLIIKTIQDGELPTYAEISPLLEACVYFIVGYLGINAGTNNVGQLFTKNKPTVKVPAKELDEVLDKANEAPKP